MLGARFEYLCSISGSYFLMYCTQLGTAINLAVRGAVQKTLAAYCRNLLETAHVLMPGLFFQQIISVCQV